MTNIDDLWASARIEAMADGNLPTAEARRMRAAMRRDPALAAAVERAVALRARLRGLERAPVPPALAGRLLAIAHRRQTGARPAHMRWGWAAGAMTAAAAIGMVALFEVQSAREREATAVLAQVETAMVYVQRSSEIAGERVRRAMRAGFVAAAETSRKAMRDDEPEAANGDGA